jgi:hypothetical protein
VGDALGAPVGTAVGLAVGDVVGASVQLAWWHVPGQKIETPLPQAVLRLAPLRMAVQTLSQIVALSGTPLHAGKVGAAVGEAVGVVVGVEVGRTVGSRVGIAVGDAVGDADGAAVGASVHPPHCPGQNSVTFVEPIPVLMMVLQRPAKNVKQSGGS